MQIVFLSDFFVNVLPGFGVKRLKNTGVALSFSSSQGSGGAVREGRQRGKGCFPPHRGVEAPMYYLICVALLLSSSQGSGGAGS